MKTVATGNREGSIPLPSVKAPMVELVYASGLSPDARKGLGVRFPLDAYKHVYPVSGSGADCKSAVITTRVVRLHLRAYFGGILYFPSYLTISIIIFHNTPMGIKNLSRKQVTYLKDRGTLSVHKTLSDKISIPTGESTRFKDAKGNLSFQMDICRDGVQDYMADEIFDANLLKENQISPDTVIHVWRPPNVVFASEAVKLHNGKPMTRNHPQKWIDQGNRAMLEKGIARDCWYNPEKRVVSGTGFVTDPVMVQEIESGEFAEISDGYDSELDFEPGNVPESIEGYPCTNPGEKYDMIMRSYSPNHIAIVPEGRAGNARILDKGEKKMTFFEKLAKKKLKDQIKTMDRKEVLLMLADEEPDEDKKVALEALAEEPDVAETTDITHRQYLKNKGYTEAEIRKIDKEDMKRHGRSVMNEQMSQIGKPSDYDVNKLRKSLGRDACDDDYLTDAEADEIGIEDEFEMTESEIADALESGGYGPNGMIYGGVDTSFVKEFDTSGAEVNEAEARKNVLTPDGGLSRTTHGIKDSSGKPVTIIREFNVSVSDSGMDKEVENMNSKELAALIHDTVNKALDARLGDASNDITVGDMQIDEEMDLDTETDEYIGDDEAEKIGIAEEWDTDENAVEEPVEEETVSDAVPVPEVQGPTPEMLQKWASGTTDPEAKRMMMALSEKVASMDAGEEDLVASEEDEEVSDGEFMDMESMMDVDEEARLQAAAEGKAPPAGPPSNQVDGTSAGDPADEKNGYFVPKKIADSEGERAKLLLDAVKTVSAYGLDGIDINKHSVDGTIFHRVIDSAGILKKGMISSSAGVTRERFEMAVSAIQKNRQMVDGMASIAGKVRDAHAGGFNPAELY